MRRIMIFLIPIVLIIGVYLTNVLYTQADIDAATRTSYNQGYDKGYDDGYDRGIEKAESNSREQFAKGLDSGYAMAMESIEERIPPSYQDAYELGFAEGYWEAEHDYLVDIEYAYDQLDMAYERGYEAAREKYDPDY